MQNLLSTLIFFPIILALPILFFRKDFEKLIKVYALVISLITFAISVYLFLAFDNNNPDFQFRERTLWLKITSTNYILGIDGIALLLIMLTTLIIPICLIASWNTIHIKIKEYFFRSHLFRLLLSSTLQSRRDMAVQWPGCDQRRQRVYRMYLQTRDMVRSMSQDGHVYNYWCVVRSSGSFLVILQYRCDSKFQTSLNPNSFPQSQVSSGTDRHLLATFRTTLSSHRQDLAEKLHRHQWVESSQQITMVAHS